MLKKFYGNYMDNINSSLIGAAISAAIYILMKGIKYYYEHYYLKSECHENKELVISIEKKEETNINKNDMSN
jgi:hypothetical protein